MNNLYFSAQHKSLLNDIRKFLSIELEPIKEDINKKNKVPISIIRKLGDKGYFGPLIDQKFSGTELGLVAHCLITEEISKRNVALSVTRTPCILDGFLLNKYGNDMQKEKFLNSIATGKKICSICVTEESAGSNVAGIKSTAIKLGEKFILNGSKKFITNAGIADLYFIWCITNPDVNPHHGMSVFIVDKDTAGLEIKNEYELMGINGIYNGIIEFKDLEIPQEYLIGKEGKGFQSLMDTFNIERLTLSSECNGISIAALEASKKYALSHMQFNKYISNFQLIKIKIADMATKIQAARLLTYNAAKLAEKGDTITKEASMAKSFSSKAALDITSGAVQIHGGNGYTDKFPVERLMRDARFFMIGGGTSEIQDLIIAREELKNQKKKE